MQHFYTAFYKCYQKFTGKKSTSSQYFPWVKVLKVASEKVFKASRGYDIGNDIAGKQKAVFEDFIESGGNYDKRIAKHGW